MKNFSKLFLSFGLFMAISASALAMANPIKTINVQQLEQLIEQYAGKTVVLNFFATWCPPCRKEIPGLVSIAKERSKDVVVIGLSVDQSARPLPDFMNEYGIKYPVVRVDSTVQKLFKVNAIPHNAVFDKNGKIKFNETGYMSKSKLNRILDSL